MHYELEFLVRDYECDLQGIVNNSVYQNYFEHTRHEFIKTKGIDFAAMHADGKDLVVVEANLKFKKSLRSGDTFSSFVKVSKQGRIKYNFLQEIVDTDGNVCVIGEFTAVCLIKNRPSKCKEIDDLLF